MPSPTQGYQGYRDKNRVLRLLTRLLILLVILYAAHLLLTRLIVKSAVQGSEAMAPTVLVGDRVLASPLLYGPTLPGLGLNLPGFSAPERGDLVLVRPGFLPAETAGRAFLNSVTGFFTLNRRQIDATDIEHGRYVVKRIIGLPGDTVRLERFTAFIRPAGEREFQNEFTLTERRYQITDTPRPGAWRADDPFGEAMREIVLGENEYFLLSDNRSEGTDSRHWGIVDRQALLARVWLRYWPFDRSGTL
jgi:signal peptidase I